MIDTLIRTFPRDAARHWPNRAEDTSKVIRYLRFCRAQVEGSVAEEEQQHWDADKQRVLNELEERRQQAKDVREAENNNPLLKEAIEQDYSYDQFYDLVSIQCIVCSAFIHTALTYHMYFILSRFLVQ